MKLSLLSLVIIFPFLLLAQSYIIPKAELLPPLKKEGNSLDLSSSDWKKNAKIIFTNLNSTEHGQIEVKLKSDQTKFTTAEPWANDGNAVFNLDKLIEDNGQGGFSIRFQGNELGTVSFELKNVAVRNTPPPPTKLSESDDLFQSYVGAVASANFLGDNKFLSNLTPIVNLGGITPIIKKKEGRLLAWDLDVNLYIGANINLNDSASFIPGMMLYGRAGISINNYLNAEFGQVKITLMPFGFGLKALPNFKDSSLTLVQHNLRFGLAFTLGNSLMIGGQITQGWHNLSSQSEKNYQTVFSSKITNITYLTVTGQFAVRGKSNDITNYIFIEWRNLLSKNHYSSFSNNKFFSIGLRKTLELSSGIFSASSAGTEKRKQKVVHGGL